MTDQTWQLTAPTWVTWTAGNVAGQPFVRSALYPAGTVLSFRGPRDVWPQVQVTIDGLECTVQATAVVANQTA